MHRSLFCLHVEGGRLHVDSRLELEIVPSLRLPRNSFVSITSKFLTNFIKDCFNQPGYGMHKQLQYLLLKAAQCEDFQTEFDFIIKFYGDLFTIEGTSITPWYMFQELGNKSPTL